MKHEFHAQYPLALQHDIIQAAAIEYLARKSSHIPERWTDLPEAEDDWARLCLLAQAIATARKEEARAGLKQDPSGYRYWLEKHGAIFLERQVDYLTRLGLLSDGTGLPDVAIFPAGSWVIHFSFVLRKPYISRDDCDLYIIDNPIKKEWVFKVPYIAPSQWKGVLHSSMIRHLAAQKSDLADDEWLQRRIQLVRLFGNEKDVGLDDTKYESFLDQQRPALAGPGRERLKHLTRTGFITGHLHFYPTFFNCIGLEVINPHPRDTGSGKQPIYLESVPIGAKGAFTLLYTPLTGKDLNGAAIRQHANADLESVAAGIKAMLTFYGFGGKTSSGFGVAEDALPEPGMLNIRARLVEEKDIAEIQQQESPKAELARYLEAPHTLHPNFRREDGSLKSEAEYRTWVESRGGKYKKMDKQLYDKARKWWQSESQTRQEKTDPSQQHAEPARTAAPARVERSFSSLSALTEIAGQLATILQIGERHE